MKLSDHIKRITGMYPAELAVGTMALFGLLCLGCCLAGAILRALGV